MALIKRSLDQRTQSKINELEQKLNQLTLKGNKQPKLNNQTKVKCVCGSHILESNIKAHYKTKKHTDFIKNLK